MIVLLLFLILLALLLGRRGFWLLILAIIAIALDMTPPKTTPAVRPVYTGPTVGRYETQGEWERRNGWR